MHVLFFLSLYDTGFAYLGLYYVLDSVVTSFALIYDATIETNVIFHIMFKGLGCCRLQTTGIFRVQ